MAVGRCFQAMSASVLRGVLFWRKPPPLDTLARLSAFCAQQSAFVAQTNLYGYLRTRAGLQHYNLFTDKAFMAVLRPARSRLVMLCLEDLILHCAAAVFAAEMEADKCAKLAKSLYESAVAELADDALPAADSQAIQEAFFAKLPMVDWQARLSPQAFEASTQGLIDLAPIVDTLKHYDTEIVTNSMRFKWMGVRAELARRLDAPTLLAGLA